MKVRARIKRVEELPEWAKCCEQRLVLFSSGEMLWADSERTQRFPFSRENTVCILCGEQKGFPVQNDIWTFWPDGTQGWINLEVLDLDEGPLEKLG